MNTWVNCEGVLPVVETFVRELQPASTAQTASTTPPEDANRVI
jgi:hypothetical protein